LGDGVSFEEAMHKPSNAWRMSEWTWGRLSREQQATSERLGRDLRQQLALLVPVIQSAPLLDKRNLARFAKLGRTMDAALRFQSFRTCRVADLRASHVFQVTYDEIRRLLDLLPSQGSSTPVFVNESAPIPHKSAPTATRPQNQTKRGNWQRPGGFQVKSQGTLFSSQSAIGEINVTTEP
jgi:hypothetical protein